MKVRREDGTMFEFELIHAARGEWAQGLAAVDGVATATDLCGPYPNEREVRRACRHFAAAARFDPEWGWVT